MAEYDDEDEWDDDDEDEALPVLTPEGAPAEAESSTKRKRRRRAKAAEPRKGNTKTADLSAARSQNVAQAQGKTTFADPGDGDWRQDLGNKDRGKAASKLTSGKLTHNSGSGFGLA